MSLRPSVAGSEEIARKLEEIPRPAEELRRPVESAHPRPEDYDAVYYPGGLREKARWTAEDETGNLFTGQNPASARPLAREFIKELE